MRRLYSDVPAAVVMLASAIVLGTVSRAVAEPDQTVRSADQVLQEVMVIPAKSIPAALLAEAQGVAIIPNVLKIGFIAGVRRGHGVVLVRDPDGEWGLPQFVTLTGGSVGWQAGVQGTDVILVFMTKKSIDGLLGGKFTIGADAAAAAGPVGRNASAATDVRLKAEILSYSRSRGLFAGLALDGSAIEIDGDAQLNFYGSAAGQLPARIPETAVRLRQDLVNLTPPAAAVAGTRTGNVDTPTRASNASIVATLRESLAKSAIELQAIVDEPWQKYLAMPKEVFEPGGMPPLKAVQTTLRQYDGLVQSNKYQALTARAEFQTTHDLLREYARALAEASGSQVALPPPPLGR
jgi:lipid-binding SYLF domain-containing protein